MPPRTTTSKLPSPLLKKSIVLSTPWPFQTMLQMALDNVAASIKEINEFFTLPFTDRLSEERIYDLFSRYVDFFGGTDAKKALADGKQVIVALRRTTNTRSNQGVGKYDDRMALIWKTGTTKHGISVEANTEPSAQYEDKMVKGKYKSILGPDGQAVTKGDPAKWTGNDVDGDKRLDAGMLVPGTHKYKKIAGTHAGGKYLVPVGKQQAYRDINHDGVFNDKDTWKKADGTMTNVDEGDFDMYIHRGGESNTWSAGCQTLSKSGAHSKFFDALDANQTEFFYVLVNV